MAADSTCGENLRWDRRFLELERLAEGAAWVGTLYASGQPVGLEIVVVVERGAFTRPRADLLALGPVLAPFAGRTSLGLAEAHALGIAAGLGGRQGACGVLWGLKACAAIDDDGVLYALGTLADVGLEHLQLKADAACFAPEQKLRIGKGHAVGIGQQGVAVVGVGVQFFPGIGQTAFIELGVRFHGGTPCFLWDCQRVGSTAQRSGG